MRVFLTLIATAFLIVNGSIFIPVVRAEPPPPVAAKFDAASLREGRFTYRLTIKGKPDARFVVTVRRQGDGTYRFTGDALGFDQHWESVAGKDFQPLSALLTLTRRGQPYRMDVTYERDQATVAEATGEPVELTSRERVKPSLPRPLVDQRIDWAAAMASSLVPGQQARFHVFDAATGASVVRVTASEAPAMRSPKGGHEVIRLDYQIEKAGGAEKYTVYATRDIPRMMLREDLREEEVAELEKIEP